MSMKDSIGSLSNLGKLLKIRDQWRTLWNKGCNMRIETNISKPMRIGYVLVGAVLIVFPFAAAWEGWIRLFFPVLGAVSVIEGLTGW